MIMNYKRLEIAAKLFYKAILTQIINLDLEDMTKEELTQVQIYCMYFVSGHDRPSVGTIADGLVISDAAAVKLIDRLVKKDILVREEDRADRRALKIKLTEHGQSLLEKYCSKQTKIFNEIIERMPIEAVSALEKGLTEFLKAALQDAEQIDEICLKCGWQHIPECPGNERYIELTGRGKEKI